MHQPVSDVSSELSARLIEEFTRVLEVNWQPPAEMRRELRRLVSVLPAAAIRAPASRQQALFALVNAKSRLNQGAIKRFLVHAARKRTYFNHPERVVLARHFDYRDINALEAWLSKRGLPDDVLRNLLEHFQPIQPHETLAFIHAELAGSDHRDDILRALFSGYVYASIDEQTLHEHNNEEAREHYFPRFFDHIAHFYPESVERDHALTLIRIDKPLIDQFSSYEQFREALAEQIRRAHRRLTNHCYFAVLLDFDADQHGRQWELFSDVTLFAEKFSEVELKKGYFRPDEVARETLSYITALRADDAHFELANEGFYYKDCFVLQPSIPQAGDYHGSYQLLLLFQKNERDETLIPCPACRSKNVRGNSYPSLGVRSWECMNTFCPGKSKFNRGKRYSLSSLINQEATELESNQIPVESVLRWKLDVTHIDDVSDVIDLLLRHYTLHGDSATLINMPFVGPGRHGRQLQYEAFPTAAPESSAMSVFYRSAYFKRFQVLREPQSGRSASDWPNLAADPQLVLHQGDAYEILASYPADSFDGAVTSPPYYNARDYAQWPNIYAYLYDMFNIAYQTHRTLKPGAPFLFNVFDYFDNENNVVFSLMGKKRMILGAYFIHLFRTLGFQLQGNVVWYKGEIEGKRNANQGNMSPYYQMPLNCYEHILVFSKGLPSFDPRVLPSVLHLRPVHKMYRGENRHGHTAPYPDAIPHLLLRLVPPGSVVLDPFSGSMTTGRVAYDHGYGSVNIELHKEYCDLALWLWRRNRTQPALFAV